MADANGSAIDPDAVARAVEAVVAAARRLGTSPRSASSGISDHRDALQVLDRLERALHASLRQAPQHDSNEEDPDALEVGGILDLLNLRAAAADIHTAELARQRSLLPVLSRSLAELRAANTIDELADAIPFHAVQLGYDRALFSWVDHERWVPRSAQMVDGPDIARRLVEAGGPPFVHTRGLLEVDVVRSRRPILVRDVEGNPRVHQGLWEVTHSDTYVAAPVVARGHVAAFVHLDRNVESGTTDEFDRDLLAAFCEGIGLMLDRLFASGSDIGTIPAPLTASWSSALTERERQVLELVGAGLTNAEIGERLFLGEETVKTHVAKILRKLGVSRRSQAGALYARLIAEQRA